MDQTFIPTEASGPTPPVQPVPTPAPVAPVSPSPTRAPSHVRLGLVLGVLGVALVAYAASAYFASFWPFAPVPVASVSPSPVASATPNPSISSEPSATDWTDFNSKYFNLSFKVPPGYVVTDSQNTIKISRGPLATSSIGATNAFFVLSRYASTSSKQQFITAERQYAKNTVESTATIDGSSFPAFEENNPPQGEIGGHIFKVFFDASSLEISQLPSDTSADLVATGKQILSTFKFSSTASWKTYTNTQYGFEVKYPTDWVVSSSLESDYAGGSDGSIPTQVFGVTFDRPDSSRMFNTYLLVRIGLKPAEFLGGKTIGQYAADGPFYRQLETKFLGAPAWSYGYGAIGTNSDVILTMRNNLIFEIWKETGDSVESQILSTFKFTK